VHLSKAFELIQAKSGRHMNQPAVRLCVEEPMEPHDYSRLGLYLNIDILDSTVCHLL
jgi:hypothetical protein